MSDKKGAEASATAAKASITGGNHKKGDLLLVAGDSERPALEAVLTEAGFLVVGTAGETGQALGLVRNLRPDLVLIHAALYPLLAFDITRTLTVERIVPVVWFCAAPAPPDLIARATESGAMGLLSLPLRAGDLGPMLTLIQTRYWEIADLETEVQTLNERMEARKLVGRAKALLMERFRLSERDAFRRIQAQSASLNKPVHEIARAIITASEITA